MKKSKILITINDLDEIRKYHELGINNFAFPLKGFCVGIPNTFLISEIPSNNYIFINRILDNQGIDELKKILKENIKNIKGIIFDDLGVLEIVKNYNIEKILYLSHFNTNSESIKIYLKYVDSVILSTDITEEEIKEIVEKIPSKLTLFTLGHVGVMYSRRLLIDNYCKFHNLSKKNPMVIDNTGHKFIVYENEYGTYFYHSIPFNGLSLEELDVKYYFINPVFLKFREIKELLNGNNIIETDRGFLDTETIYKLKGEEND